MRDPAILEQTLSAGERRVLRRFADKLRERFGEGVEVVVFGSRARGDCHAESDIDVMVVLRSAPEAARQAVAEVWDLAVDAMREGERFEYAPIQPLVLSATECDELVQRERRLALDVQAEGIRL